MPRLLAYAPTGKLETKAEGSVIYHRVHYLPRFRPYVAVEYGYLRLSGGYVWRIDFDAGFTDLPAVVRTALGYWELRVMGHTIARLPLPSWLSEVTKEYFKIYTLPVGEYRLAYVAVGPV